MVTDDGAQVDPNKVPELTLDGIRKLNKIAEYQDVVEVELFNLVTNRGQIPVQEMGVYWAATFDHLSKAFKEAKKAVAYHPSSQPPKAEPCTE